MRRRQIGSVKRVGADRAQLKAFFTTSKGRNIIARLVRAFEIERKYVCGGERRELRKRAFGLVRINFPIGRGGGVADYFLAILGKIENRVGRRDGRESPRP